MAAKLRIAMISPEYPPYLVGGLGTHVQQLARGLSRAGCEVFILTASEELDEVRRDGEVTIRFVRLPSKDRKLPYQYSFSDLQTISDWVVERAIQLLEPNGLPALIHAHEFPGFLVAKALRVHWKVPVLTTVHSVYAELRHRLRMSLRPDDERLVELEGETCRNSDRLIAVSNSVRKEIARIYSVPENRIDVIFNGFDAATFLCDPHETCTAAETERKALNLTSGKSVVMFAGRIQPHKGLLELLRSAVEVIRQRHSVQYLIVGDITANKYADMLLGLVKNHPLLRNSVVFGGRVSRERLGLLYQLADIVVVPSLYEPFGYAATEAMAAGKAVIATNTGGLSEIIEHERSGLLIPMRAADTNGSWDINIPKFVEAQLRLLNDPALALQFARQGQYRVATEFSLDRMVHDTLRCYQKLAYE